jgi:hypothetical protein
MRSTTFRRLATALLLLAAGSPLPASDETPAAASVGAGARPASVPEFPIEAELLQLRESAWRHWFAGDEAALRAMLPPEFIGLDMSDGPFRSLEETLGDSRAFRAGGGKLVRLEFPETRAQRFGDVVVLYGRYSVTLLGENGEQTLAGRLTEVFVRRDGRWWHPGWHLDLSSTP